MVPVDDTKEEEDEDDDAALLQNDHEQLTKDVELLKKRIATLEKFRVNVKADKQLTGDQVTFIEDEGWESLQDAQKEARGFGFSSGTREVKGYILTSTVLTGSVGAAIQELTKVLRELKLNHTSGSPPDLLGSVQTLVSENQELARRLRYEPAIIAPISVEHKELAQRIYVNYLHWAYLFYRVWQWVNEPPLRGLDIELPASLVMDEKEKEIISDEKQKEGHIHIWARELRRTLTSLAGDIAQDIILPVSLTDGAHDLDTIAIALPIDNKQDAIPHLHNIQKFTHAWMSVVLKELKQHHRMVMYRVPLKEVDPRDHRELKDRRLTQLRARYLRDPLYNELEMTSMATHIRVMQFLQVRFLWGLSLLLPC